MTISVVCIFIARQRTMFSVVSVCHSVHRESHVVTISHDALDLIIPLDIHPPASDMSKLVQLGPHCSPPPTCSNLFIVKFLQVGKHGAGIIQTLNVFS